MKCILDYRAGDFQMRLENSEVVSCLCLKSAESATFIVVAQDRTHAHALPQSATWCSQFLYWRSVVNTNQTNLRKKEGKMG